MFTRFQLNLPPVSNVGQRYLIPIFIAEQETKAQSHLYQLALLSQTLNRTLVLPNVANAYLGARLSRPFSLYYDERLLAFDELGIKLSKRIRPFGSRTTSTFFSSSDSNRSSPSCQRLPQYKRTESLHLLTKISTLLSAPTTRILIFR